MTVLIYGHKSPDTDSIVSAISLSYLKNKIGLDTEPVRLGVVSKETSYVLKKFNVEEPRLINDVKTQVEDLKYEMETSSTPDASVIECYKILKEQEMVAIPVLDEEKKLKGIVAFKDMAKSVMDNETTDMYTSIKNIVKGLQGKIILQSSKELEEVEGSIKVVSHMDEYVAEKLKEDTIVITSDNDAVIKKVIDLNIKLVVLTDSKTISNEMVEYGKGKSTTIVSVPSDIIITAKNIEKCRYISGVMNTDLIKFEENMYLDEVREILLETKIRTFPVVDNNNRYLGSISRNHVINPNNKKVILVDHNEYSQSADGTEEAEILEIVDHHKVGGIMTDSPINFRNMVVGSCSTIIAELFKEENVEIPKDIAGLLLSGIVSDTLLFRSPTTTELDKRVSRDLNKILKIDIEEHAMEMFRAGTSLDGFSIKEIFYRDFKEFDLNGNKIGIGQVFTLDKDKIMEQKEEYLDFIRETHKKEGYYLTLLALTDIINEGSYILFESDEKELITASLDVKNEQGVFVEGLVSRKKQLVPGITRGYNICQRKNL